MYYDVNIIKLLQKLRESTNEDVKEVPQTMKPQEEPEVDTPDDMEDIEKEDPDKLDVSKKKDRKDAMKEIPDKELEIEPQERRGITRGNLYLCNSCCKTFEGREPVCTFCESKEVEQITEQDVPLYKHVYEVYFEDKDGAENSTRVTAHDEQDAVSYVRRIKPGIGKVTKVEQVAEGCDKRSKKQTDKKQSKKKKSSEGKEPADKDSEETKIKKLIETVSELISEVPGISANDQKLLHWALKAEVISNEFPDSEVMFDELSHLADVVGMEELKDLGAIDKADVHGYYLKYALLPKIRKAYVKQYETSESLSAEELKSLDAPKLKFDYQTVTNHKEIMEDLATTNFLKNTMVGTQIILTDAKGTPATYAKDEDKVWKPFTTSGFVEESKLREVKAVIGVYVEQITQNRWDVVLQDKYGEDDSVKQFGDLDDARKQAVKLASCFDVHYQGVRYLGKGESKTNEVEDGYAVVANGLEREDADYLAAKKGGMVITDEEDKEKFSVIIKEK